GRDVEAKFQALAEEMGKLDVWTRLHYVYPYPHVDAVIPLMAEGKILPYLDIPFQHASPKVLKAMKRPGNNEKTLERIKRWRRDVPDFTLRSTFIVGFPGETEEHFQDLMAFIRQARFDHLGAFAYSPEEGTPGAALENRVPRHTQRRRLRQLLEAQKPIALAQRQRLVGNVMTVLVEGACEESEHLLQGRHYGMAPQIDGRVLLNDGTAPAGTLVQVKITEAYADDVVGHIVGAARPQDADRVTSADLVEAFA
ncbi:MAG TPA: radical SAM protein, partial [Thermoanaerobaculia bacterium]|nr:radical SAM protein [Thermoanaerobaculia bacterium]